MGHAVFVFGAAGAGKSTFCRNLRESGKPDRNIKIINLDPAQESASDYDLDLCEFITVNEVMEEMDYGPNGGLFYALKEMIDNIDELNLNEFEEDYFIFDCPGQIELFIHSNILQECVKHVQKTSKVAMVYLLDGTSFIKHGVEIKEESFEEETNPFQNDKLLFSLFCAALCMQRFYLPVINIITKADLVDEKQLEYILGEEDLFPDQEMDDEYGRLRNALQDYVRYNGMNSFLPINWNDEDMVQNVLLELDHVLQRYDDVDVKNRNNDGE